MTKTLVTCTENVTLVGGGVVTAAALALAVDRAPRVIAADGGADRAKAAGIVPTTIIGDIDSLSKVESWQNSDVKMFKIDEQETTDFEKCLYSVEAPLFLGVGFLGARTDHALATISVMVRLRDKAVVLLGDDEVIFAAGPRLALELPEGTAVSLFPFANVKGVSSWGLRWSVAGLTFAPDQRIGTSNIATGDAIRVEFDRAGMVVRLPLSALDQAIREVSTRAH